MDLDSYQIALEEVLTWLLSAEDTFQEQDDISDDVEEVKDQFATHEVSNLKLMNRIYVPWCLCLNQEMHPDVHCLLNSAPQKFHGII